MSARETIMLEREGTASGSPQDTMLRELTRALEREVGLVSGLRDALQRQRAGIAANDTDTVQSTCDEIAHILSALETAREGRGRALEALTGDPNAALSSLERFVAGAMPAPLAAARRALRAAAESAATETATNHVVLQRTLEAGEAFLQALFSNASDPDPVYRAGERRAEGDPGFLVDRKA
jgi:hypothetical protein